MKRFLALSVVLGFLVAACSSTSEPLATDQPPTSAAESPDTTSTPNTTTPPATTTPTVDPQAELEEAKALMTQPELSDGGILEQNGAFAESTEGLNPFEDLEILVYDDGEHLNFYIEGPADLVRELVIEFDAQDSNGAVIRDTSYVGDLAVNPPAWAIEAQNGNTVRAADNPPPEASAGLHISTAQSESGDRLGALLTSEITTLEEFVRMSIWIYWGLADGRYNYAHYIQLYENLVNDASDGAIVAAFFTGQLGAGPPPLVWFFSGG